MMPQTSERMHQIEAYQMTYCSLSFHCLPLLPLTLSPTISSFFSSLFMPFSSHCSSPLLSHVRLGTCSQSRLARLVVGPFWGWNCTGGRPSVQLMRLCSGRLQAAMWSCRSCWEKFWCIWAASWASIVFPQALFRSLSSAEDQSCTDISGILLASCMAGTTILLLSLWFPRTKKIWPSRTSEQAVSLFRSSAFDIFRVSLRNLFASL